MAEYTYIAKRFSPRSDSNDSLLLFVASATDIQSWAGVPRKAFDYLHGFQRTLDPSRVNDVSQFFKGSPNNISPTSVVVGFTGPVKIVEDKDVVHVTLSVQDLSGMSIETLIEDGIQHLKQRLPTSTTDAVDADIGSALAAAMQLQEEEAVDEAFGISSESSTESTIDADAGERSYLADFYAQLLGYRDNLISLPEEQSLREVLYSLLKPAIIVDGQHRVFGAALADQNIQFAVCAMPNSNWVESVYQFVVINQKAKPIKPAFLSSIIATSLSSDEIDSVYDRLRGANVDVARAEMMDEINSDPQSPFKDMIDFEVKGSPGFLQFPGMTRLARDFSNIPRSHPVLLPDGSWEGVEGGWLQQFFAFWRGVRKYFETADPRLWREPSADNPNHLLMIVTLQELQGLMLDNWADSRIFKLTALAVTEKHALEFWADFPSTFFSDEWRQKGLQTSVGRNILRSAMTDTRRNIGRKNWGHRRLTLFQG